MKLKYFLILVGFFLINANFLNAQMTKSQLQEMYVSYLKEQGYQPAIDSDGDVVFKAEGRNFYIHVQEKDLGYFRIVFPNFWEIESHAERIQAFEAASYATRTTKTARVFLTSDDDTTIDACIFIAKPEDFKLHFNRMLDVIMIARRDFVDRMRE